MIRETRAGEMFEAADVGGVKDFIFKQFNEWKADKKRNANPGISKYSRKELTQQLVELL